MGNVFNAVARRSRGFIPVKKGISAVPKTPAVHGLLFDDVGNIFVEEDGVIGYYNQGLPFTSEGRLAVTQNAAVRITQGVPFAANGMVSLGDFAPPVVSDIVRIGADSCTYPAAGSCVVQTVYQAIASSGERVPPTTVTWGVDNGASIVSGQGTAKVIVDGPDGDVDVTYNVTLTVTNSQGSDILVKAFTDTKTQI